MLKHCVETMFGNNGEGLLQACISSIYLQLKNYFIHINLQVGLTFSAIHTKIRTTFCLFTAI